MPKAKTKTKKGWKFVTMMAGYTPVEVNNFNEAFKHMFTWVQDQIDAGQMTHQVLETAIWIDTPTGVPIFFYDARDKADASGLTAKLMAERKEAQAKAA